MKGLLKIIRKQHYHKAEEKKDNVSNNIGLCTDTGKAVLMNQ